MISINIIIIIIIIIISLIIISIPSLLLSLSHDCYYLVHFDFHLKCAPLEEKRSKSTTA